MSSFSRYRATPAERFFYTYAGCGYDPRTETRNQGRWRGARELAAAEHEARRRGWCYELHDDANGCETGWGEPEDAEHAAKHASGELAVLECALFAGDDARRRVSDRSRTILASLGGICVAGYQDPYVRVVQAELALEALHDEQRANDAADTRCHTQGG